jgi:hypothetical protein
MIDRRRGKWYPSLRTAAKIGPNFLLGLDFGSTKASSLRFVLPYFHLQRNPPGKCEQALICISTCIAEDSEPMYRHYYRTL